MQDEMVKGREDRNRRGGGGREAMEDYGRDGRKNLEEKDTEEEERTLRWKITEEM